MTRLRPAKRFYLSGEIGVERRQLDARRGFGYRKRAAFFRPQASDGLLGKQDTETVADLAEFSLHEAIITEVITRNARGWRAHHSLGLAADRDLHHPLAGAQSEGRLQPHRDHQVGLELAIQLNCVLLDFSQTISH